MAPNTRRPVRSTSLRTLHAALALLVAAIIVLPGLSGCSSTTLGEDEHAGCDLEPQVLAPASGVETDEGVASTSQALEQEELGTTQEELSSLNCKMSGTTGYKSGNAFKIKVVTVDGKKVEWKTANAYMQMAKAASKAGVEIRIVSGFRSMAEQQYLYNCYKTCSCNSCNLAATPGYSNHQSGHALDLNTSAPGVYSWMQKHAGKYGFKRTVPGEPWHWEWWGSDDGTGPCNGETVKAKLTKKWSNAKRFRGKGADYIACAGDKVKMSFTFKNRGTAVWRDVKGRGKSVGSDVFLVTANGKKDKLTGKKRLSLQKNANSQVRGDKKAKNCSTKNGCRRTTFVKGGITAVAPNKPGVYASRWRLRDYSKVWGKKSKGFGPKVQLRLKVVKCEQPKKECGCRVWCSNGKSTLLAANITSGAQCKDVAQTFCKPGNAIAHEFNTCAAPSPGTGGTGGTGGEVGGTPSPSPSPSGTGEDPAPAVEGDATEAEEGDELDEAGEDAPGGWATDDDADDPAEIEPDDLDFDDGGFDGDEEGFGDAPDETAASCAVRAPRGAGGGGVALLLGLVTLGAVAARRRRRSVPRRRAGLVAILALATLALGCGPAEAPTESARGELRGDSPLVQHFRDAERESGVPAELLATIAYVQSRLSMNVGEQAHDTHNHAPREWGVMAIGTGGLTTLEQAAAAISAEPADVAVDARLNVRAAAALLSAEASKRGLEPRTPTEWAPVLVAYGGEELSEAVRRLVVVGWQGTDDDDRLVEVTGTELEAPLGEEGAVQQALGFPGAKWSPAYSGNYSNASRGKGQINYVVIHTTQGSYAGTINWFKNPAANVSSHYVVRSSDGAVTQMVDDRDIAWHDGCFNTYSIGIEHEGFVSQPKKWYTDSMYRSSARLTSWLCDKYGIPKDRKHIMGHGETPDCSDHYDPGSGWNWSHYMKLVKSGGKIRTLKAKLSRKWSNAKKFRGKQADYIACAGKPFKFTFTFKNTGSATWRDVDGRGKNVGNDVFLVTANGKKDKLTGKTRLSVRHNKNSVVRGDKKAKNCSSKNGCRRTTFIEGAIKAKAPNKTGVYTTRWRLRDYSKEWGKKSKGFGPKVGLRFKVVSCELPKDSCGCRVWCSNGKSHKLAANIGSNAMCKSVAETYCKPDAAYVAHDYVACTTTGTGGVSGVGGGGSGGSETGGGEPESEPQGAAGAGGVEEEPAASGEESEADEGDENAEGGYEADPDYEEDPEAIEEEDDADFDDYGFDGDDSKPALEVDGESCSVARAPGSSRTATSVLLLAAALAMVLRRRRRRSRGVRGLVLLSGGAALLLLGCSAEMEEGETLGFSQEAITAPKKAYCSVPVEGKGVKQLETDYLPHVITCENGGADLEALKAQAIAARSVAYYAMATKGSICDSQGCQVYGCGVAPSEKAKRAVRETAGMILSYDGVLTYAFYVAGDSGASAPSCKDYGGYTSHYVTYNAGKTGKGVKQTSLGYIGPPGFGQNRGCMSQWGARCLENKKGYDFRQILRFYYGSDIKILQATGPCVGEKKTLKAKAVRKWSNLRRFRGKKADYVACAGQPFDMAFTFKNKGTAVWRDVKGRGKGPGSDVFLVTADGKKDKLTGRKRFSLRNNKNAKVRGDKKAKNCSTKDGCRKTTFVAGGMPATAPKKPGIYTSRWRLRDYSKTWGKKSHGFGPKVQMKVRVLSCELPKTACGCRVWCSDGKAQTLPANISTASLCKSVAETVCKPDKMVGHDFQACSVPGTGGTGGTGATPPEEAGGSESPAPESGASESPPEAGAPGAEPEGSPAPAEDLGPEDDTSDDWGFDDGDNGDEDLIEPEDDPDFVEDGFNGDADGALAVEEQSMACSVGNGTGGGPRTPSWPWLAALVLALGARRAAPSALIRRNWNASGRRNRA